MLEKWLLSGAVVIVVVLASVAIYYLTKLKRLQRSRRHSLNRLEHHNKVLREKTGKSVLIIAQAIIAEQMSMSEGAIRISILLEGLGLTDDQKSHYVVFSKLAQSISHIPILEGWKQLSVQQKRQYEVEIDNKENQYRDFILDAAKKLISDKRVLSLIQIKS